MESLICVLEGSQGLADFGLGGWLVGFKQRSEQSVAQLGVEHGDADPFWGERVGVAVGEALDESV